MSYVCVVGYRVVNVADCEGVTPLMLACQQQTPNDKMIDFLLNSHAGASFFKLVLVTLQSVSVELRGRCLSCCTP